MTPDVRASLLALAEALPLGSAVSVPREWLLELLAGSEAQPGPTALPLEDMDVAALAARFGRKPSTVRAWLEADRFPGAYKLRGRDWRAPAAAVAAFEAHERQADAPPETPRPTGGRRKTADLSAWRRHAG